jgi:hypothetical protein
LATSRAGSVHPRSATAPKGGGGYGLAFSLDRRRSALTPHPPSPLVRTCTTSSAFFCEGSVSKRTRPRPCLAVPRNSPWYWQPSAQSSTPAADWVCVRAVAVSERREREREKDALVLAAVRPVEHTGGGLGGLHTGRIPTLVTRRVCNCVCVSGPHSVPALSPCAHILATVVQTVWYPWRVRSHPPMTWWRTVRSSSCRLTRHPTHLLRPAPAPWDQHSRVHGSP